MNIQMMRRGTASALSAANVTPAAGEMLFESDTGYTKIGDGYISYNSLNYTHNTVPNEGAIPVVRDLYVTTAGTDQGSGSLSVPWRQPQSAVDYVTYAHIPYGSIVNIHCGSGEFETPDVSLIPRSVNVFIYGNRGNLLVSGSGAGSSAMDGYAGIRQTVYGSYSGSVGIGTHWIHDTTSNIGGTAYPSESPDGYYISPISVVSQDYEIYPIETTFTSDGYVVSCDGKSRIPYVDGTSVGLPQSNVTFFGIEFKTASSTTFTFRDTTLYGCALSTDGETTNIFIFERSTANITTPPTVWAFAYANSSISGLMRYRLNLYDSSFSTGFSSDVMRVREGVVKLGTSATFGVDFRTSGSGCIGYTRGTVNVAGNITVGNNLSGGLLSYSTLSEFGDLSLSIGGGLTITGSVTGVGISFIRGVAAGVESACDGNLTCGGNDVEIAVGTVTSTFAGLPISDVGQTVPYFARCG